MAIFVPKMLRSGRQLHSAPQTNNSTKLASDSSHFTSNDDDASKRHSFLAQLDPQMVAALLAAGPSSLAARASLAHSFGSALWLAQAIAQEEGDSTCTPVVAAEETYNYALHSTSDAAESTSSLAASCSTRYSFDASTLAAKVGIDHLTYTLGKYDQAKVIDITPSESMHTIERKMVTESKEKKAKGAGGAFFAGLRKLRNSARKMVNLNPHKSTGAVSAKTDGQTQVVSVNSFSSLSTAVDGTSAVEGQGEPAKLDAPDYEREVLSDYSDEHDALAANSTPLDALFGGESEDEENSSPPSSPLPSLDQLDTRFFPLSSRLSASSPWNRTKRRSLFELTMLSAQKECSLGIDGAVDFSCGAGGDRARRGRYGVGWGEDWSFWAVEGHIGGGEEEEVEVKVEVECGLPVVEPLRWTRRARPMKMGEVDKSEGVKVTMNEIVVEDGAGVVGCGGGAKKSRRGSRVWFC